MAELVANRGVDPKISEIVESRTAPWVSIEFFPPKTPEGVTNLFNVIKKLQVYNPIFADFTWGAGGSTSDLTLELCIRAKNEAGLVPNMHLTCTNMEKSKIDNALKLCHDNGIRNILALRGDPPAGETVWHATEGGLTCALDLVNYINSQYPDKYFDIAIAGYPEGHPTKMTEIGSADSEEGLRSIIDSLTEEEKLRFSIEEEEEVRLPDPENAESELISKRKHVFVCRDAEYEEEMSYLKKKVDAGASMIVTQMFFCAEVFAFFVRKCREIGITIPIIPGIMCVSSYGGFVRMTRFCKTRVPERMMSEIEAIKSEDSAVKEWGVSEGIKLCQRLLELGVPGLHFYTLNASQATIRILQGLGFEPQPTS